MFGFTNILSASVALLLAAQSASTAPTQEISRSLSARQSPADSSKCKPLCDQANVIYSSTAKDACTDANADKISACISCAIAGGGDKEGGKELGDVFNQVCADAKISVKPVATGGALRISAGATGMVLFGLVTASLVL
ncbi:hypothetical protein C8J57DRAFT_1505248 [Mycena rebaudengoi]|nr:hypothetical protein C8J57DRAFT_1505248 [Mycena rebaudengoi]